MMRFVWLSLPNNCPFRLLDSIARSETLARPHKLTYKYPLQVRCIVLTGSEKAFAAGADISEMQSKDFVPAYR